MLILKYIDVLWYVKYYNGVKSNYVMMMFNMFILGNVLMIKFLKKKKIYGIVMYSEMGVNLCL